MTWEISTSFIQYIVLTLGFLVLVYFVGRKTCTAECPGNKKRWLCFTMCPEESEKMDGINRKDD
jgi:hypothetical protein